jgi:hypothetical protein
MNDIKIDQEKVLLLLLEKAYSAEFQIIDGLNRHPDYISFYEWLRDRGIIDQSELNRITTSVRSHETDVWELCEMAVGGIALTGEQRDILVKETQNYEGCDSIEYYNGLDDAILANRIYDLSSDYIMGQL